MRGACIEHPHAVVRYEAHRLAGRVVGQAEHHDVGLVEIPAARLRVLARRGRNLEECDVLTRREPLVDPQSGRARLPVDEYARHRLRCPCGPPRSARRVAIQPAGPCKPRSGTTPAGTAPRTTDWPCRTHGAAAGRLHPQSTSSSGPAPIIRPGRQWLGLNPGRSGPMSGRCHCAIGLHAGSPIRPAEPPSPDPVLAPISESASGLVPLCRLIGRPEAPAGDPPPDSVRPDPESPESRAAAGLHLRSVLHAFLDPMPEMSYKETLKDAWPERRWETRAGGKPGAACIPRSA